MGVWGGICAFDEQRFREVVAPALRTGQEHPMIAGSLELLWAQGLGLANAAGEVDLVDQPFPPCRYEGLAAVTAHIDDTFTTCDLGRDFWVVDGMLTGPDEPQDKLRWDYWALADLVEWVITREALRAWAHLGLGGGSPWRVFDYHVPDPDEQTEPGSEWSKLQDLLVCLDTGSGYWVHGSGGFGEGICGWLNSAQTCELATLLPRPVTGSSDERVQERIWTVLEWSIDRGLGLLWGRDLRLFYVDDPMASILGQGSPPIIRLA